MTVWKFETLLDR